MPHVCKVHLATRRGRQVLWSWNSEWLWAPRCGSWEADFDPLETVLTTATCLASIDRNFILLLDYLFLAIQNSVSYASFSWWLLDVVWELGKFVLLLNYRRLYLYYFLQCYSFTFGGRFSWLPGCPPATHCASENDLEVLTLSLPSEW